MNIYPYIQSIVVGIIVLFAAYSAFRHLFPRARIQTENDADCSGSCNSCRGCARGQDTHPPQ